MGLNLIDAHCYCPHSSIVNNCLRYSLHTVFMAVVYEENHHNKYLYLRISVATVVYFELL